MSKLLAVLAVCLVLLGCTPSPTTGLVPVNGHLDSEGNSVQSWCAQTTPGFRVFFAGNGSGKTMAVVADARCNR